MISIQNCRIENSRGTIISEITWNMKAGEAWLVIGPNGGGKADFLNALAGNLRFVPNMQNMQNVTQNAQISINSSLFANIFADSCEIISLERAAKLIEEERENDESDYVEGGVDIGRTGRIFIAESLCGTIKKNSPIPDEAKNLEAYPEIKLCGVEKILDRGLKFMSTGEIRRTLLARALVSKKRLLILSDPFAGLDAESRKILLNFFTSIVARQTGEKSNNDFPTIILGMERWHEIPDSITNVLEFADKKISFCGTRAEYEKILLERNEKKSQQRETEKKNFSEEINQTFSDTTVLQNINLCPQGDSENEILVQMNDVNVGWGENRVLRNLNWTLKKNEHWLIRGPNGSGKTTFLELITGDNGQVYSNDVWLFGKKRGTGETVWEIKEKLGIVSYRLHVEYRMVGSTSLRDVIISGFRDSIGLYETATDIEISAAMKWLKLGGFFGRENELFKNLSYGEQRAILILRSAVKSPKILILDEPCHGLDENYREKILNLLEIIAENKTSTLLHVTHDPTEKLECEKHILELNPNSEKMYKIIVEGE